MSIPAIQGMAKFWWVEFWMLENAYNYFYPSGNALWLGRFGGTDSGTYFPTISSSTNYPADQGYGISAIEALDGGDLLIAGEVSRIRGSNVGPLAHLLPDGSVDTQFNSNVGMYPYVIAKQPDGKYIVAGFSQYTPLYGQILRRNAMDAPRSVTFTSQPAPANNHSLCWRFPEPERIGGCLASAFAGLDQERRGTGQCQNLIPLRLLRRAGGCGNLPPACENFLRG